MSTRPVELDDLLKFNLVGEAQISPDGTKVAFTVTRTDSDKNQYRTAIWLADTATGAARQFTGDGHSDGSPRWSPDGTQLAFTSDRSKPKGQVWLIAAGGGEARALTSLDEGSVRDPVWSPDGTRIAFMRRATPEAWTEKAKKEREEKGLSAPVRVHRRLFYRLDGFGYFDDSYWQIWVADASTGEARQLTFCEHHHGTPAWSPDGRALAYVADHRPDADIDGRTLDPVWTIPAEGGEPQRVVTPEGPKAGLAYSPDGHWLAYVGHTRPDDDWGHLNERVLVIPAGGAPEARDLTGHTDTTVGYLTLSDVHAAGGGPLLVWSPDSTSLHFPMSHRGDALLARVNVAGGPVEFLTPAGRELGAFSLSADGGTVAVTLSSATALHDVYVGAPAIDGAGVRRVSDANAATASVVAWQEPETFHLAAGDGASVQGWALRPAGLQPGTRYPCVLYVHGGPAMQYGGGAVPFHELQWLAANGYAVVFSNPRGSKGYGEAHTRAIQGDWGIADWADIQAVADHAAALPYVDATRMAIMGGSYGGFMTAWAVGHTDRFACAITDRLVGNLHSFTGTVDFPFRHGASWKGNAWDDPSDLWRCSPLASAGKVTTPLMIVHSDGDLRCPIEQAEQLFAALRHRGCDVEFVRYPAESSHGLSRNGPPDLRLDRLRRNLAWLDAHLKR